MMFAFMISVGVFHLMMGLLLSQNDRKEPEYYIGISGAVFAFLGLIGFIISAYFRFSAICEGIGAVGMFMSLILPFPIGFLVREIKKDNKSQIIENVSNSNISQTMTHYTYIIDDKLIDEQ